MKHHHENDSLNQNLSTCDHCNSNNDKHHKTHELHGHEEHDHIRHHHEGHHHGISHSKHSHSEHVDHTGHEEMFRKRFWISLILSIPVLIYSPSIQSWLKFKAPSFPGSQWIPVIFSVIIFLYGGLPFIQMAIPEIKRKQPGMMTLISMAISIAFIYSLVNTFTKIGHTFFWELVTLIDIMLLGHWLEMRSVRKASSALEELSKLLPDKAEIILPDGSTKEIPISKLKPGDIVLVRPGANIPADGVVIEGTSSVNEAMITGESKPVKKGEGDKVIAGTVNLDGSLRVKVLAVGDNTVLAGIMRLIREAQASKSKTQLLADKVAGWLFYASLGVATISAIGWVYAVGFTEEVLRRVVTVLVIACPHALGLAIPLAVAITTELGAKNGILVRDRIALEKAKDITLVAFDKTGTLTEGRFGVASVKPLGNISPNEVLSLAASIERDSEHLIAKAIREEAERRGLNILEISDFKVLKGIGVEGKINSAKILVGSTRLIQLLNIQPSSELIEIVDELNSKAQTPILVIRESQVIGVIGVSDIIRPESKEAIKKLHQMGLKVAILTGDSESVAKAVGNELGVDMVFSELLPEDKVRKIEELQAKGYTVAMVGDGINDAPALVKADVGIAIGSGTNIAIESAGIILVKSNPLDIPKVIKLARLSYRKMVQNLWWAAGYNAIALPLAGGVLAPWGILPSPAFGALLMSLSTIIVAINSQLLRRAKLDDNPAPSK